MASSWIYLSLAVVLLGLAAMAAGLPVIRPPRASHDEEDRRRLLSAGRRARLHYLAVALPFLLIVCSSFILILRGFSGSRDHRVEGLALGLARGLAADLSEAGHAELANDTGPDDPRLRRLEGRLVAWLSRNPAVLAAYTMRERADGVVTFVLSPPVDYDGNGRINGEREARLPPGTVYPDSIEELFLAFGGRPSFQSKPSTDAWGRTISAFAPIAGPDGSIDAIVGLDFNAEDLTADSAPFQFIVAGLCLLLYGAIAGLLAVQGRSKILSMRSRLDRERIARLATQDHLTGAANRYALETAFESSVCLARRNGLRISLILFDVDRFKAVNDSFGHAAGDRVLAGIVGIARDEIRASDLLARWGGDEFAVLLPATGVDGALRLAERLRDRTRAADFGLGAPVSLSLGVACLEGEEDLEALMRRADAALYRAKSSGRDKASA
ncbi:MAG: GGDEF domain-containing protein [Spirochaetaceae bacterium]|nr:GGDEF domain-containing protein [Spirochaetaceae bacterium]